MVAGEQRAEPAFLTVGATTQNSGYCGVSEGQEALRTADLEIGATA